MHSPARTLRTPRALGFLALAAAGALALTSCASDSGAAPAKNGDAAETVDGGTLVYATGDAEPDCLDPHVGGNYPQALISTQYLEPLVGRDADGTIQPWLATEWTASDDGLTWDFTLKSDVTFTDGTPLDAEAVKVNVEHLQDPKTASSTGYLAVKKIKKVEAVDATHVRFHMAEPDSALLESMSQQWTAIESPAGIARGQEENCKAPVGTGPFIVESWTPQQQVDLVRNDDYATPGPEADHDGPAHLERIEWRFVPDAATRNAALTTGEVNVIDNPLPADIVAADTNDTITHLDAPRPGSANRIELNSAQAPFDDIKVREAFVRSADIAAGIETLFMGTAMQGFSPLSSTEPTAFGDPDLFSTDVDKAAKLLDDAGWKTGDDGIREKDGKKLTVRFPVSTNQSTPTEQSLFEQIQANTKQVGFDVQIEPVDLGTWYAKLGANEYEAVSAPYTKVGPDVLRILYHSDGIVPAPSGYFANHAQLSDPALDELLDEASATLDAQKRTELYQQAQQIILDSYTVLPIYDQQNHFLMSGVTGMTTLGTVATPTFAGAQLTK